MIDVYVDLVFCNDSVLRVKSYHEGKEIYYPLSDLQSYYEEDESFIIRFFQQNVFFEQNRQARIRACQRRHAQGLS